MATTFLRSYGGVVCLQSLVSSRRNAPRSSVSCASCCCSSSFSFTVATPSSSASPVASPPLRSDASFPGQSSISSAPLALGNEHPSASTELQRRGKGTWREGGGGGGGGETARRHEEDDESERNAEENEHSAGRGRRKGKGRGMVKEREAGEGEDGGAGNEEGEEGGYGRSHTPVLLSEVLRAFHGKRLRSFLDCTLGAAGHASAIIKEHPDLKTFIGIDVDPKAHLIASPKLKNAVKGETGPEVHIVAANFGQLKSTLCQLGLLEQGVDGILMDLGMSSMQLDEAGRGFSLQQDGPLDMRMNPLSSLTAGDILNSWPEAEIGRIIRDYGEERQWKRLARKISEVQLLGGINSTSHLLQLIQECIPSRFSPGRPGWKKTAIRVFQALRIAVNDELSVLEGALPDAFDCLRPKGRLAVISFHSLEDRIVKQFFLKAMGAAVHRKSRYSRESEYAVLEGELENTEGKLAGNKMLEGEHAIVITRKPLIAGVDEVKRNPRSRSAKLRVLEKK